MELETLFGLPAHPLMVHVPVVLIPLAALIAIAFAIRPAWLDRYGWGLVALTGIGAVGAILAAGSGEGLEEIFRSNGETIGPALEDHAELGEIARNLSILFFFVVLAVVVLRHLARRKGDSATGFWAFMRSKGGAIAIAVVLVLSAGGAMFAVAKAGHQGAKITWEEDVPAG